VEDLLSREVLSASALAEAAYPQPVRCPHFRLL